MPQDIIIKGAKEHNLKNVNLTVPRDKLVVFTGLSGSGKSSLAFDTIYAEGQRRYMESLSSYARQFLGQMNKPDVESIEGLSPAISIDQKTTSKNPRSTVGTVTEIYDYLRLLYARIGVPHCPTCNREITHQTIDQITDKIMALGENVKIQILSPIVRGKKGEHSKELENLKKNGFVRARIDGEIHDLSENISLSKNQKHSIDAIVDRIVIKKEVKSRISEAVESACDLSGGIVTVNVNMEKDIFNIDKNKLSYGRGYVYSLQYHLVWCTKYRKKVLKNGIDTECKEMLQNLAEEYKFQILAMEVMPDHIHLLVDCKPQFYISDMIKIMKGNLARQMFLAHPELKKELWGGHLWNPSYCAITVSDRSRDQVLAYIEGQKEKEKKKA